MQGARIRTSAVRDIRWISRQVVQLLVDADYVSAFTTDNYQSGRDYRQVLSKPGFLAPKQQTRTSSLLFVTLEAATAEATKIRVQIPGFSISTLEIIPKESLPVKKVTDKEPAAPAADPPSDTAAEITPATQDDGATPTVTPIADIEMCL
ncbi:hypothetical protein BASA83_001386 [Batrachochytrium salamandrivorans]|nr:hypothetical protein BASA83_001386 [Batrachochytrium salamandrivorans]